MVGRTLWLWLGVLDAIQGVGFGMILLQTLTRFHIVFTLVCAQVLGSIATIVARACAPDAEGPGAVFPNLALSSKGLGNAWFWIALLMQLSICVGFFKFFRKVRGMVVHGRKAVANVVYRNNYRSPRTFKAVQALS